MLNAKEIEGTLKSRKYNKAKSLNYELAEKIIEKYVHNFEPISLVAYWGVANKKEVNEKDKETLEFLSEYNDSVKKMYVPGVKFNFVIADKHAELNGYCNKKYVTQIEGLFAQEEIAYQKLSELWIKYGLDFEKINKNFPVKNWSEMTETKLMEKNASKVNIVLENMVAAQKYYLVRREECKVLENEYKTSLFFTFGDSRIKSILPKMPVLFLYARNGWSNAPWFSEK